MRTNDATGCTARDAGRCRSSAAAWPRRVAARVQLADCRHALRGPICAKVRRLGAPLRRSDDGFARRRRAPAIDAIASIFRSSRSMSRRPDRCTADAIRRCTDRLHRASRDTRSAHGTQASTSPRRCHCTTAYASVALPPVPVSRRRSGPTTNVAPTKKARPRRAFRDDRKEPAISLLRCRAVPRKHRDRAGFPCLPAGCSGARR